MEKLEALLKWGGVKKDVICLVLGGISLLVSIIGLAPGLPFDPAWVAIILCGVPIILEAVIGLVTAFDIKADVLVSMALIASVIIGEDFAAGEVAFTGLFDAEYPCCGMAIGGAVYYGRIAGQLAAANK